MITVAASPNRIDTVKFETTEGVKVSDLTFNSHEN